MRNLALVLSFALVGCAAVSADDAQTSSTSITTSAESVFVPYVDDALMPPLAEAFRARNGTNWEKTSEWPYAYYRNRFAPSVGFMKRSDPEGPAKPGGLTPDDVIATGHELLVKNADLFSIDPRRIEGHLKAVQAGKSGWWAELTVVDLPFPMYGYYPNRILVWVTMDGVARQVIDDRERLPADFKADLTPGLDSQSPKLSSSFVGKHVVQHWWTCDGDKDVDLGTIIPSDVVADLVLHSRYEPGPAGAHFRLVYRLRLPRFPGYQYVVDATTAEVYQSSEDAGGGVDLSGGCW